MWKSSSPLQTHYPPRSSLHQVGVEFSRLSLGNYKQEARCLLRSSLLCDVAMMLRWAQTATSMKHEKSKVASRFLWVPRKVWGEWRGPSVSYLLVSSVSVLGSAFAISFFWPTWEAQTFLDSTLKLMHTDIGLSRTLHEAFTLYIPHAAKNFKQHLYSKSFQPSHQWEVLSGRLPHVFHHLVLHLSFPDRKFKFSSLLYPSNSAHQLLYPAPGGANTKAFHCPGSTLPSRHLVHFISLCCSQGLDGSSHKARRLLLTSGYIFNT